MFTYKLFGKQISPSCSYCEHGDISREKDVVYCKKKGVVSPTGSCRKFLYAPLKRVPMRPRSLPKYNKEDFEL